MIGLVPVLIVLHARYAVKAKKVIVGISCSLFIAVYLYRMTILHSPVLIFAPQKGFLIRAILWIESLFV
jgi:hypothetical protein